MTKSGVGSRIKSGLPGILTRDFSRGKQAHYYFVGQTVLTVSKCDIGLKTDKSVWPNGTAVRWPTTKVMG